MIAPAPSMRKALDRAGWKVAEVDLLEIYEAFACVAMAPMVMVRPVSPSKKKL